jgi:beta-aspartyl-peptidase (threonine type)
VNANVALLSSLVLVAGAAARAEPPTAAENVVLAIHGGAGVIDRKKMTPELEKAYRDDLTRALQEGYQALQKGTSLDGVEAAIKVLEDSPRFNAGRGAVFTHDGRNELDAALMDGSRRAGAVAGVTRVKNPIAAARAVLEQSEQVLLVGEGADRFAIAKGVEEVSPVYFWTEHRWKQLQDALREEEAKERPGRRGEVPAPPDRHFGTVGAVALWKGRLAVGTSTGGLTNKRPGRVGDSPIVGAGTYAEDGVCAVSATGHGEVFIQHVVAYDIAARIKYKGQSVAEAAEAVLRGLPGEEGGVGGLIAVDAKGNLTTPFNTPGMYRGHVTADGKVSVAIYAE